MKGTFQETLDYLFSLLPMYQRVGSSAIKKNLDNTIALCVHLGDPHLKFRSIHIAGTNGKGSTAHMLASVLQSAGYHTGLYTSPHLKSFTERIKINGVEISEGYVVEFVRELKPLIEEVRPSFFELTVAMAFKYFADNQVDVAVVEVGLGGRLDSTNIITPMVSLITNIGLDHHEMLGDTLPKIAFEKAGIIKENVPVVISEYQEEVQGVFTEIAGSKRAPLYFTSKEYQGKNLERGNYRIKFDLYQKDKLILADLVCDLPGEYQIKNIPAVIKVLELLPENQFVVSDSDLRKGLAQVVENTGLKGRWQVLQDKPLVVCDTAHNEEGMWEIVQCISGRKYENLHLILGMVKEKNAKSMINLFPKDANYYFCQPNIPRMQDAKVLLNVARESGRNGKTIENVNNALKEALSKAKEGDLIFIGGSNFVIAELNNL